MLADRVNSLEASGIRKIFELVASMKDPINLSIGQADFDIPDPIKEAAIKAINEGFNRYTITQGIPELNDRILASLNERYNYTPESSLVTCGVSGGLVLALLSLINPGDEVLLPDPFFVMYKVLVELCQGVPKYYNLYPDFKVNKEDLESQVTEKTKVILINSPSNPTGAVLGHDDLTAISDVAKKNDLVVISDEIYDRFIYTDRFRSISEYLQENLILLGGFSKTYAMPGWRMGYAVGPTEILDKMMVLQQFTFVCAPSFAQKAVLFAFDVDMSEYIEKYRKKRDLIYDALKDKYKVIRPEGSFYIYPQLPEGMSGKELIKKALDQKVLVVPGTAFSRQDTHFRISFAAPDKDLIKGAEILRSFV